MLVGRHRRRDATALALQYIDRRRAGNVRDILGLGPVSWLKSGAVAGLVDGDPVTTWEDSSLSNNDATSSGAARPIYKTNVKKGKPVIRFDGIGQFMSVAGITANDPERTIFVAAKRNAASAGQRFFGFADTASVFDAESFGAGRAGYFCNEGFSTVDLGGNTDNWQVFAIRWNGTTSADGFVNAGSGTNFDPSDAYQSGGAALHLGANSPGANFGSLDMGEVLVFDGPLSDADRLFVTDYLMAEWTGPDPVDGPQLDLVWDTRAQADGAQLDLVWDLIAQVNGGQLDLLWDLRSAVDGGQLDLLWDLRSQVNGGQLDLIWDVLAQVSGAQLDLVWDTRAEVAGAALDLLWDLRAAVNGPALDLVWDLAAEGVEPPPPTDTGAAGGRTFQARWSEVDGPPLTLRWGSVSSPSAGEGALTEQARPVVEPVVRKPFRLPKRERPRPRVVERPRVPVDAVPLELRWAVRGAVEARVALKWAATEDAMLVGLLQARVAAYTAEVARLTRDIDRAREEAEATARGRIRALEGEVERLRDEAESLELLLLSE